MIFVTVGTHEQPFDRLIKEIDRLKGTNRIKDDVYIQTGYSTYSPKYCQFEKFIPIDKMYEFMKKATTIITHGGPSTFMMALQYDKVPIVVPRMKNYDEHVNNHQVEFTRDLKKKNFPIVVVEDITMLEHAIQSSIRHPEIDLYRNNENFTKNIKKIVDDIIK